MASWVSVVFGYRHAQTIERQQIKGVAFTQIVAGALVAEASMKALGVESVDICPWALREGLILRRLDSEADGSGFVGGAGNPATVGGADNPASAGGADNPASAGSAGNPASAQPFVRNAGR